MADTFYLKRDFSIKPLQPEDCCLCPGLVRGRGVKSGRACPMKWLLLGVLGGGVVDVCCVGPVGG
jgi:hypothetical protein